MAEDKKPEFELIRRNAPQPESNMMMPILGLVVLLALGIGGYFAMHGASEGEAAKGGDVDQPNKEVADTPPPDYVWEPIDFNESEGRIQTALEMVEDALKDYPNSRELKARRQQYRQELGLTDTAGASVDQLKVQAKQKLADKDWEGAVELLDQARDQEDEDNPDAEVYFLLGNALGEMGEQLDALSALQDAKDLGYAADKCDALMRRYQ